MANTFICSGIKYLVASQIRNAINRLLWDKSLGGRGEVVFVNRTERGVSLEVVGCDKITEVAKDYFKVGDGVGAKYIPFHRVVEVRSAGGLLWKSRKWKIQS